MSENIQTGLLFGSFNPIHKGHLKIATYMLDYEKLNEVWFVVSPHNPLKDKGMLVSKEQRLEMTRLAAAGKRRFKICDIEFTMPEPSFTIDTLRLLRLKFPQNDFYLMIGSDNLQEFDKWKDYKSIINEFQILVYPRGINVQTNFDNYPNIKITNAPLINISSTEVRQKIMLGKSIERLVPASVNRYIINTGLYRE